MKLNEKDLKDFLKTCEPFNCEFSFQFELAWWLKEKEENAGNKIKIKFEDKDCYENKKDRCDLVIYDKDGNETLIELKYVHHDDGSTTSVGARKSFVKDFRRLKKCIKDNVNAYCIFLTNWKTIYNCQKYKDSENEDLKNFKKSFTDNKKETNENNKKWKDCNWKKGYETESKNLKILLLNVKEYKK